MAGEEGGSQDYSQLCAGLKWFLGPNSGHFSSRRSRCFGVAFPWLLWGSRSGVRCPHPTGVVLLASGLTALQGLLQPWRWMHIPLGLGVHCSVAHGFGEHNSRPLAPEEPQRWASAQGQMLYWPPSSLLRSRVLRRPDITSSPVCSALQAVSITTCPGAT